MGFWIGLTGLLFFSDTFFQWFFMLSSNHQGLHITVAM